MNSTDDNESSPTAISGAFIGTSLPITCWAHEHTTARIEIGVLSETALEVTEVGACYATVVEVTEMGARY